MNKSGIEARSGNSCCREKTTSIIYSGRVSVALGIRHVKRMHRLIFSRVICPTEQYISTLSHKQHDFGEQVLNIKCVFGFSKIFDVELHLWFRSRGAGTASRA
jgi:hypothetical protein